LKITGGKGGIRTHE